MVQGILKGKVHLLKGMVFPVVMYNVQELDHKERWAPKNCCFQTGVGEDSQESLGLQGDQTRQS